MIVQAMPYPAAAAGGGATSDQWRLFFPEGSVDPFVMEIAEVEMRATPGGADQCNGGTASASSAPYGSAPAAGAFDNSTGSVWSSATNATVGAWLQYTFTAPVEVNEVTVLASGAAQAAPKAIDVEYWDGTDWVKHYQVAGPLSWTGGEQKTFTKP